MENINDSMYIDQVINKPHGGRIITDLHIKSDYDAKNSKAPTIFNQYEILQMLERVGKRLPPGESGAIWTDALIAHYRLLVRYTQDQDWYAGNPIVWLSVAETARKLDITPKQVNRNENQLMRLGVLAWSDSSNHKRYGSRDNDGNIIHAYGVNLMPSVNLIKTLEQFEIEIDRHDNQRRNKKSELATLRRSCKGRIHYLLNEGLKAQIKQVANQIFDIINDIRVTSKTTIEQIQKWIDSLKTKQGDLETAVNPQISGVECPNKLPKQVVKDPQGELGSPPQRIQKNSPRVKEQRNTACVSGELPDENGTLPNRQCQSTKRRSRDVDQRQASICKHLSDIEAWGDFRYVMHQRVIDLIPDYFDTDQLIKSAMTIKKQIGISNYAWNKACEAFGDPQTAAVVVFMIATKHYAGIVERPGGYLTELVTRENMGTFKIWGMLKGLGKLREESYI